MVSDAATSREASVTVHGPKWSEFNVLVESFWPDTYLLYNSFSGALLEVDGRQKDLLGAAVFAAGSPVDAALATRLGDIWERLTEDGFVIGSTVDERAAVRDSYWRNRAQPPDSGSSSLGLTIAPTVSCNFRCTYCFEEHPNRFMDDQDLAGIVRYVDHELAEGGTLGVVWFGGEPFAAFDQMKDLEARLRRVCESKSGEFTHSFITNGSLLHGRRREWLVALAPTTVQITVDGSKRFHDVRRVRAGGTGSYDHIMRNVQAIAPHVPVVIRVNVDWRNMDGLSELLDDIVERGLKDVLAIDLGHTRGYTALAEKDTAKSEFSKVDFARARVLAIEEMCRRGFYRSVPNIPTPLKFNQCIADSPRGVVFSPGGMAFKCWNEAANSKSSAPYVYAADGKLSLNNEKVATEWEQYNPFAHDECKTCKVQPLCRGGCPWLLRGSNNSRPRDRSSLTVGAGVPYSWCRRSATRFTTAMDTTTRAVRRIRRIPPVRRSSSAKVSPSVRRRSARTRTPVPARIPALATSSVMVALRARITSARGAISEDEGFAASMERLKGHLG